MTVESFIGEWRDKYAAKELEAKTLDIYLRIINKRIVPYFGHMRLDQVKPLHILSLMNELNKPGSRQDGKDGILASGSVQVIYRVLKKHIQTSCGMARH
jgi:integrase